MKTLKYILDNILVIVSIIYLWILPVAGYKGYEIKPYHLAFALLALGIYLGDKITTLKQK